MTMAAGSGKKKSKSVNEWLLSRAVHSRWWIALSIASGLLGGLLMIVQAFLIAEIIHEAVIERTLRRELYPFFGGLAVVIVGRAFLSWGREVAGFHAAAKVRRDVRMELLDHIAALGPHFMRGQRSGALVSTAMEQIEALQGFFAHYLPQLALAAMLPLAVLLVVFPVSWAAGGMLLFTAPFIPLFMVLAGVGAEEVHRRNFKALSRLSAHFLDTLRNFQVLKLFDRIHREQQRIAEVSDDYRRKTMAVLRIAFVSAGVLEFFSSLAIAIVAVYLGMTYLGIYEFGHYHRPLILADGLFILLLAPEFYLPLRELGAHYHARAEAAGAAEEIIKVLSIDRPQPISRTAVPKVMLSVAVRFRNVDFQYENNSRPALSRLSFDLRSGEQIAVVGSSGAGKTTLLNLLAGFIKPDRGQIIINSLNLNTLDPDHWRRHLSWISQFPYLFHGSIRDNIRLGRPNAANADIDKAARDARVPEFTAGLPKGLDTLIGERGGGLSRGQAQRVALARAFLRDAPLLLLDEPTAGLDSDNERLVLSALTKLSQGKSVVMLTHRFFSIEQADRILVLDRGRLAEQGTYDELVRASGLFSRLLKHYHGKFYHA